MRRALLTIVGCALFAALATPTFAATGIAVNGACAIEGSFGLEVTFDGTTSPAMVIDNTPNDESVYRATFRIRTQPGYTMSTGDNHIILLGRRLNPSPGNPIKVLIKQGVNNLKLVAITKNDSNADVKFGRGNLAPGVPTLVTVEWNNSGVVRLYKQNTLLGPGVPGGFTNSTFNVGQARLGAPDGIDAGTSGSYCVDGFESFSTF